MNKTNDNPVIALNGESNTHPPELTGNTKVLAGPIRVGQAEGQAIIQAEENGTVRGKPRFLVDSNSVINAHSGFSKKLLCDGLTFTAGQACAYSCTFCYVGPIVKKVERLRQIMTERNLKFENMVVDIKDAATKVREYLTTNGKPRFKKPKDKRVIYGSPLVDIAATMDQVRVTVDICKAILELTNWQIRLLSKSSLIKQVAQQIPDEYKTRVIYGLSTGTLDSELAKSFEKGTALVSKRLESLQWLQANGYRTFGMICPILPQKDYGVFAKQMAATIDVAKCEHVWAEVINLRGDSLTATAQALKAAGYQDEAELLEEVMADKKAWENYARATFEALAEVVPHKKLRFLQYVNKSNKPWWAERVAQGAVLLANVMKKKSSAKANQTNATPTK